MSDAAYDPETLLIGVMGRPHGLRGELALRVHNPRGSDLTRAKALIFERDDGHRDERRLVSIRRVADGWLIKIEGIESRTHAQRFTNAGVRIRRASLPAPGTGEFFVEDTIGCGVFAEDGTRLGRVDALFWNGAQDVLVVAGADVEEILIPAVPEFIRLVDAPGRRIVVAWSVEKEVEEADG